MYRNKTSGTLQHFTTSNFDYLIITRPRDFDHIRSEIKGERQRTKNRAKNEKNTDSDVDTMWIPSRKRAFFNLMALLMSELVGPVIGRLCFKQIKSEIKSESIN